jgi:WD40 repeat protein
MYARESMQSRQPQLKRKEPTTIVQMCPHDSTRFVFVRDHLCLYKLDRDQRGRRVFRATNVLNAPNLRCLDWCPHVETPLMIGVGMGSGKMLLADFDSSSHDAEYNAHVNGSLEGDDKIVAEFTPKVSRTCNAMAWNAIRKSHIAVGLEKVRSGYSTLVWDITRSDASTVDMTGIRGSHELATPLHELAASEAVVSLSWVPEEADCLATGTSFKWLRFYDFRTSTSSPFRSINAHTKSVFGVKFDPTQPWTVATYSDGPNEVVKIWDTRRMESNAKPVATLQVNTKLLTALQWSPYRSGVLATAVSDQPWVSLWDTNQTSNNSSFGSDLGSSGHSTAQDVASVQKPLLRRYGSKPVIAFTWQPRQQLVQSSANANVVKNGDNKETSDSKHNADDDGEPHHVSSKSIPESSSSPAIMQERLLTVNTMGLLEVHQPEHTALRARMPAFVHLRAPSSAFFSRMHPLL